MSEKILIIDDEQDIANLLEVYLKNENYVVHKFYCATDAMSCIESGGGHDMAFWNEYVVKFTDMMFGK